MTVVVLWIANVFLCASFVTALLYPQSREAMGFAAFGLAGIVVCCLTKLDRAEQRKNYERQWAGGNSESGGTQGK